MSKRPPLPVHIILWPLGAFTEDEQKIIRDATDKISGKYYDNFTHKLWVPAFVTQIGLYDFNMHQLNII